MKITLNNRNEEIEGIDKLTVQELLDIKKFSFKFLVIKINNKIVRLEEYSTAQVVDGDIVSVFHLISGG
jgi:sulfur carrier protein